MHDRTTTRRSHRMVALAVVALATAGVSGASNATAGSAASSGVILEPETSNRSDVERLVIRRHPGRSSKDARAFVAESFSLGVEDRRLLGDGFETITLADPITADDADRLTVQASETTHNGSRPTGEVFEEVAVVNH